MTSSQSLWESYRKCYSNLYLKGAQKSYGKVLFHNLLTNSEVLQLHVDYLSPNKHVLQYKVPVQYTYFKIVQSTWKGILHMGSSHHRWHVHLKDLSYFIGSETLVVGVQFVTPGFITKLYQCSINHHPERKQIRKTIIQNLDI